MPPERGGSERVGARRVGGMMFAKLGPVTMLLLAMPGAAGSAEPGAAPVPAAVIALSGCWTGKGAVMGKPVAIALSAYPIVQDAMLAVEAASSALADPSDDYAAHLIFGGDTRGPTPSAAKPTGDRIVGYWADSFGGAFAATGRGESRAGGFDITYRYANGSFVNRWRGAGDRLTWQIVSVDRKGRETPFAHYALTKTACRSAAS